MPSLRAPRLVMARPPAVQETKVQGISLRELLGNPVLADAYGPVRVAEGLADALPLASRFERSAVALLGTSGYQDANGPG